MPVRALPAFLFALLLGAGVWATRLVGYQATQGQAPPSPQTMPVFSGVPMTVGHWHGRDQPIPASDWKIMGADAALSRVYEGPECSVRFIVEARMGKSRDQFHLPMVCMTANGWSTLKNGVAPIHPPGLAEPVETVWLLMTQAGQYTVVRYWLWADGRYTAAPSDFWRQMNALAAWERLRSPNPTGALFLCYTKLERPEQLQQALAAQAQFAESILPPIDKTLGRLPGLRPENE
jgi:EpsI family protein